MNRSSANHEARGHTVKEVKHCVTVSALRRELTLVMSSTFLNSPLTSVTFPFSSNSVQRSLSSLVALLRPNTVSAESLSNGGRSAG
jgi:hypothetical protein